MDFGRVINSKISLNNSESVSEKPGCEGKGESEKKPGVLKQEEQTLQNQDHDPRPCQHVQLSATLDAEKIFFIFSKI